MDPGRIELPQRQLGLLFKIGSYGANGTFLDAYSSRLAVTHLKVANLGQD